MSFPIVPDYSPVQKASHWLIVLLCTSQLPTAWAIQRTHVGPVFGLAPAPLDIFLHKVHAWNGWTILLLATVLLALRVVRGAPGIPHDMAAWQRWLAYASHFFLYACIFILAVTGTGAMYLSQRFAPIHVVLVNLGIALVLLHAVAAVWHQAIRRDGLLSRMLPNRSVKSADVTVVTPAASSRHTAAPSR
jgi:cytochrome b561